MQATAILPARYASSRFPGKPLVPLAGRPVILHVAERLVAARAAGILDAVLVATDDRRILEAVRKAGFDVQHTSPRHPTGTDRVAEAARYGDDEVICNVPCDEPGISPETLEALIRPLRDDPELPMSTLKIPLARDEDRFDEDLAKVAVDERGRALTFSRQPLVEDAPEKPGYYARERVEAEHARLRQSGGGRGGLAVWLHLALFAYQREFLLRFTKLARTHRELMERLEPLRALEHGFEIAVPTVEHRAARLSSPGDLERVEAALLLAERG